MKNFILSFIFFLSVSCFSQSNSPFVGVHGSETAFPNPATFVVNVLLGVQQDIVSVQLWSQSGLLLNETLVNSESTGESIMVTFNIETLPPGIYFIKVNYANHTKTIPIIIN